MSQLRNFLPKSENLSWDSQSMSDACRVQGPLVVVPGVGLGQEVAGSDH